MRRLPAVQLLMEVKMTAGQFSSQPEPTHKRRSIFAAHRLKCSGSCPQEQMTVGAVRLAENGISKGRSSV